MGRGEWREREGAARELNMATRIDTSNKLLASRIPHDELTIRMDSGSCQRCSSFLLPPPPSPSPPCLLAARGCLPSGLGPARVLFLVWPFPDWDSVALVECFWALRTVSIPPPPVPSFVYPSLSDIRVPLQFYDDVAAFCI